MCVCVCALIENFLKDGGEVSRLLPNPDVECLTEALPGLISTVNLVTVDAVVVAM